jgi:hypothetical protein
MKSVEVYFRGQRHRAYIAGSGESGAGVFPACASPSLLVGVVVEGRGAEPSALQIGQGHAAVFVEYASDNSLSAG